MAMRRLHVIEVSRAARRESKKRENDAERKKDVKGGSVFSRLFKKKKY